LIQKRELIVISVNTKKRLQEFIKLPWNIYDPTSLWIPPLVHVQKQLLNIDKNPFFEMAEMAMWIVKHGNNPVGRIAAIINKAHNEFHKEKTGFWGFFESIDNQEVANLLFKTASTWLQDRGMNYLKGPVNLSTLHETGLLIKGYDTSPAIDTLYNPPYYQRLILNSGFRLNKILLGFYLDQNVKKKPVIMPRLRKWSSIVQERSNVIIKPVSKRQFERNIDIACKLYNEIMMDNWGYYPVNEKMFRYVANNFKELIIPELTLIAEINSIPVGLSIAIPDVNPIIKKINGRLFPFGFLRLLMNYKRSRSLRVILMGVVKKHRFKGIETVFIQKTIDDGTGMGFEGADLSWLDSSNQNLINSFIKMKANPYKEFGIFELSLGKK